MTPSRFRARSPTSARSCVCRSSCAPPRLGGRGRRGHAPARGGLDPRSRMGVRARRRSQASRRKTPAEVVGMGPRRVLRDRGRSRRHRAAAWVVARSSLATKAVISEGEIPAQPIGVPARQAAVVEIRRHKCSCGATLDASVERSTWATIRLEIEPLPRSRRYAPAARSKSDHYRDRTLRPGRSTSWSSLRPSTRGRRRALVGLR